MLITDKNCFDEHSMYWLSISSGIKINQNGFLFLESKIRMPKSYPCRRTMGALCQYENYTFLPCTGTPRTMVTDAPKPFDRFWTSEHRCSKYPTESSFDIIPCDLSGGTSILWSDGRIAVQYDQDLNSWANLFVLLIMIWLIINLGEGIALILEVKGTIPHNHNTIVLCVALLCIIIGCTDNDLWATYNDLTLYWCTIAYVSGYALYHIENRNTVNIIVGCMMLVAARFYQTFETPYTAVFLFLISTRFVQKCYYSFWGKIDMQGILWYYVRYIFIVFDVALFVILYIFSFIPTFKEPIQAHLYLLGLLYSSVCVGSFIANFVKSKSRNTPRSNPKP